MPTEERITLESCICGGCYDCPDGCHSDADMPCSCTADCALPRMAYCGRSWVGDPTRPGHAETESHPDLAFFQSGFENTKHCAVCGMYEEPHLRVTSVAKGAKRIDDHVFAPRPPLDFDTYYCGHNGWD